MDRRAVPFVCVGVGVGSGAGQNAVVGAQTHAGGGSEVERFLQTFDDLKIAERPVAAQKSCDPQPACRALTRLCACHQKPSVRRHCLETTYDLLTLTEAQAMKEIQDATDSLQSSGPARLLETILLGGSVVIPSNPSADLVLGNLYLRTNYGKEIDSAVLYAGSDAIDGAVSKFVREHSAHIKGSVMATGDMASKGLWSSMIYLDEIANNIDGFEEDPTGIHIRAAATLAAGVLNSRYADAYKRVLGLYTAKALFHKFFSLLHTQAVLLPRLTLANLGLKNRGPLYEECIWDITGRDRLSVFEECIRIGEALKNRVSVAVNVSTAHDESLDLVGVIQTQVQLLSREQSIRPRVRYYLDIWSVGALHLLKACDDDRKLKTYADCLFGINLPDVFETRATPPRLPDTTWTFFSRAECEAFGLDGKSVGSTFSLAYRKAETTGSGITVSITWVLDRIAKLMAMENTALVYSSNVSRYTLVQPETTCLNLGVDVDAVRLGTGVSPVFRAVLNIAEFVSTDLVIDGPESPYNTYVGPNGANLCFFGLREITKVAVVVANVLAELSSETCPASARENIAQYRSVSVGFVGLSSALTALQVRNDDIQCTVVSDRVTEQMQFAALQASMELCRFGFPKFGQFHKTEYRNGSVILDCRMHGDLCVPWQKWNQLRQDITEYGLANAHLVSIGPQEELAIMAGVSASFWAWPGAVCSRKTPFTVRAGKSGETPLYLSVVNHATTGPPGRRHGPSLDQKRDDAKIFHLQEGMDQREMLHGACWRDAFVDQVQPPVLYLQREGFEAALAEYMKLAHDFCLKVAVYKCQLVDA